MERKLNVVMQAAMGSETSRVDFKDYGVVLPTDASSKWTTMDNGSFIVAKQNGRYSNAPIHKDNVIAGSRWVKKFDGTWFYLPQSQIVQNVIKKYLMQFKDRVSSKLDLFSSRNGVEVKEETMSYFLMRQKEVGEYFTHTIEFNNRNKLQGFMAYDFFDVSKQLFHSFAQNILQYDPSDAGIDGYTSFQSISGVIQARSLFGGVGAVFGKVNVAGSLSGTNNVTGAGYAQGDGHRTLPLQILPNTDWVGYVLGLSQDTVYDGLEVDNILNTGETGYGFSFLLAVRDGITHIHWRLMDDSLDPDAAIDQGVLSIEEGREVDLLGVTTVMATGTHYKVMQVTLPNITFDDDTNTLGLYFSESASDGRLDNGAWSDGNPLFYFAGFMQAKRNTLHPHQRFFTSQSGVHTLQTTLVAYGSDTWLKKHPVYTGALGFYIEFDMLRGYDRLVELLRVTSESGVNEIAMQIGYDNAQGDDVVKFISNDTDITIHASTVEKANAIQKAFLYFDIAANKWTAVVNGTEMPSQILWTNAHLVDFDYVHPTNLFDTVQIGGSANTGFGTVYRVAPTTHTWTIAEMKQITS